VHSCQRRYRRRLGSARGRPRDLTPCGVQWHERCHPEVRKVHPGPNGPVGTLHGRIRGCERSEIRGRSPSFFFSALGYAIPIVSAAALTGLAAVPVVVKEGKDIEGIMHAQPVDLPVVEGVVGRKVTAPPVFDGNRFDAQPSRPGSNARSVPWCIRVIRGSP